MPKIILSANTDWYLFNFRRSLALQLQASGWEVVLFSPNGPYTSHFESEGMRWLPWRLGRQSLAPWLEWPAFRQALAVYRREKPDLVHHHTIKPSIYGSAAAARSEVGGIVNSITGRGYVFLGREPKARLLRAAVRAMYRHAFRPDNLRAIFENQMDRDYFIRHGLIPQGRTALVESVGVDPERFHPSPEPAGKPVVLMAARMLWDKGAGVLVEAARRLGAPEKVRVLLAGQPDPGNPNTVPLPQLEAWQREGVVEWLGFQPDVPALLAGCHIFTLPTMYGEGIPVALLEAAASGRPVVTTDIPGPRDFVQDGVTGILVPPDDPEALARALESLLHDPDRRGRMGAAGRQRVLERFTQQEVNRQTIAIYHELLGAA